MKKKRKALLLALVAVVIVLSTIGIVLFGQTPSSSTTTQSSGPELPTGETPPNLLVIPEVPIGTLAILAACFFALIVSQMKNKAKLQ